MYYLHCCHVFLLIKFIDLKQSKSHFHSLRVVALLTLTRQHGLDKSNY